MSQDVFYLKVLELQQKALPAKQYAENAMRLILDNHLHYDMMYDTLARVFVSTVVSDEDLYAAVLCLVAYRNELKGKLLKPVYSHKKNPPTFEEDFHVSYKMSQINDVIFELYAGADSFEEVILDFTANAKDKDKEVSIYRIIHNLFYYKQRDYIFKILIKATEEGIVLRDTLQNLKKTIETTGRLPDYMH